MRRDLTGFLTSLGVIVVFDVLGFLYQLPAEMLVYASVLSIFLIGLLYGRLFYRLWEEHKQLRQIRDNLPAVEHLPEPLGKLSEDYQELIHTLMEELREQNTAFRLQQQDRNDYFTMWVHQIKTPIAAMDLSLQSEDSNVSRELQVELQKVEQYVEMVLSYIRLEEQGNDWVLEEFDLNEVVKSTLRRFAKQFIRSRLQIVYEEKHVFVLSDKKWLTFVLGQLLSNALKYTKEGAITIVVKEDKTMELRDTGIGIAPEDLQRVCEKGFTGYNGRSNQKSTGLGLYLCKKVLTRLGHELVIASEICEGTTVRLNLAKTDIRLND